MSTYNICYCGEIRKNLTTFGLKKKRHLSKSYAQPIICEKKISKSARLISAQSSKTRSIQINNFSFLHKDKLMVLVVSASVKHSNEYPHTTFLWRNKKNIKFC